MKLTFRPEAIVCSNIYRSFRLGLYVICIAIECNEAAARRLRMILRMFVSFNLVSI